MPAMPHVHAFGRPWLATGLLLASCWLTVTGKAQLQRHQRGHSAQQCGCMEGKNSSDHHLRSPSHTPFALCSPLGSFVAMLARKHVA